MKIIAKLNKNKIFFVLIQITAFFIMLYLSYIEPLDADDFWYITKDKNLLGYAVKTTINYYLNSGGRCLVNGLMAFFINVDRAYFAVVNSIIYVIFAITIYLFAFPYEKSVAGVRKTDVNNTFMTFVYCALWFSLPTFGQVALWITGSLAYLWPCTVLITFIHYYYLRFSGIVNDSTETRVLPIKIIGMAVWGFLAGSSIEPCACILMVMIFSYVLYMRHIGRYMQKLELVGIVFAILGFVFLFTAPGIYKRGAGVSESANILVKYGYRFLRTTYYFGKYELFLFGVSCALIFIGYQHGIKALINNNKEQIVLIVGAFLGTYVMVLSPGMANRIFIFPVALLIMAIGISFKKYMVQKHILTITILIATLICVTAVSVFTAVVRCNQTGEPLRINLEYNTGASSMQLF